MKKFLLKQNIEKQKKRVISFLWYLGERAFLTTLGLILVAVMIAAFLFFQYVIFSPQGEEKVISEFQFNEKLLEGFLLELDEEEIRAEEADFLTPRDLFNP